MQVDAHHLGQLLYAAVESHGSEGLIVYPLGDTVTPVSRSYEDLLSLAEQNSKRIKGLPGFAAGICILLHFEHALDNIVWFWSTLLAGAVPAISIPLSPDTKERSKHLWHLANVLQNPIVLTRDAFLPLFDVEHPLTPVSIERLDWLSSETPSENGSLQLLGPGRTETALIMLTSGSTGNSKAVPLSHSQILAAVQGKSLVRRLPSSNPYLNWIGLDHVASMVEIHIQALFLRISQVHVRAPDIISSPLTLLKLCDKHRVSRTFAPNSFLKRLSQELRDIESNGRKLDLDLSCLQFIASGGEANTIDAGVELSTQLVGYGAPKNAITPGFGMTETCAGAIFNTSFPENDKSKGYEYASLGSCMPGIEMRIWSTEGRVAEGGGVGELQLRGHSVFKGYLNNPAATSEAITDDGWFKTGDEAFINEDGHLKLVGRTKDTIVINGVKYLSTDIESAIENATIKGIAPSFLACFGYRGQNASTENICVTYLPTYAPQDYQSRAEVEQQVASIVMLRTGCRPYILPLSEEILQKTTIGKLSRQKLKVALEEGRLKYHEDLNATALDSYRSTSVTAPTTDIEHSLHSTISTTLGIDLPGIDSSFFEVGVTSIELIRLKSSIESSFSIPELPLSTLICNPTVRSLAQALTQLERPQTYNPIVPLQHRGARLPLWLVHPGVGEVLIFLSLASKIRDRPVFALRARGFNGEEYFSNIEDAVATYHAAIKERQPHGPYVLAGYSYGSMLAFEITKVLESHGDEVRFLGSFNLPPHIKTRMEQLDWVYGLLHLSYFLGLISEEHAHEVAPRLRLGSREDAVKHVAEIADRERLEELKLSIEGLVKWTNLSYSLQSMAKGYEPGGRVDRMDVFMATPLKAVSPNRKDWREKHLERWRDFVGDVRFHEVEGNHYTMIAPENVDGFWEKLNKALEARGA